MKCIDRPRVTERDPSSRTGSFAGRCDGIPNVPVREVQAPSSPPQTARVQRRAFSLKPCVDVSDWGLDVRVAGLGRLGVNFAHQSGVSVRETAIHDAEVFRRLSMRQSALRS